MNTIRPCAPATARHESKADLAGADHRTAYRRALTRQVIEAYDNPSPPPSP